MQLLNDTHFRSTPSDTAFRFFQRLPVELRLIIWLHTLRRSRWVPLDIVLPEDEESRAKWPGQVGAASGPSHQNKERPPSYTTTNSLGRVISGNDYYFAVHDDGSALSPLLRVSKEARKVALDFYRLRLPVHHRLPQAQGRPLYLNPEWDVIFLRWAKFPRLLADVLHDIKAYDVRDVGVVHLAPDDRTARGYSPCLWELLSQNILWPNTDSPSIEEGVSPCTFHPLATSSFKDTLKDKLRSVFYVLDFLGGSRIRAPLGGAIGPGSFTCHHGRGHPLQRHLPTVTFFDWLHEDSRPVAEDLKTLQFFKDPRKHSEERRDVESLFGITRQADAAFDFYLCLTLDWRRVNYAFGDSTDYQHHRDETSRGLGDFIKHDEEEWHRTCGWVEKNFAAVEYKPGRHGSLMNQATYDRLLVELHDVVDIWVFKPDAFGEVTPENRTTVMEQFKRNYDVSASRPSLVVFENPAE
ncbi:hypothetical protein GGTG_11519 [Gaeumannomyces tritici R3-111a-1]|uniref:2EXR domain-containing protein n=1 Tax=Gaeumannomyces tritici (strain R3-111a-1) TaxID=644352 RepID=J3PDF1_GAET3|nr:hypothetical protein GGTG_11519 [Gaeumannomyces tritici R3-111a-1]EJT70496.1 hypothetical protein GGTG_11519 [Gaeumannomyces tritici R3-111a-1]